MSNRKIFVAVFLVAAFAVQAIAAGELQSEAVQRPVVETMIDSIATYADTAQTASGVSASTISDTTATDTPIPTPTANSSPLIPTWESWTSPGQLMGNIRIVAVMAALSLAPALLLMTTCYVRLVIVLSLLRQALGSQQLPPNQVTTTLAMFLTALIMWPVWNKVNEDAIKPYSDPDVAMSAEEAWTAGVAPVRKFMSAQIRNAKNEEDVSMFLDYLQIKDARYFADVPLQALLPAFLISELKVAFAIGFQVFLPFVIVDLVVSSVTMSMGWVMVPPTTISLPLKLMLFVLVDGWHLVVQMLLLSFQVV